MQKLYLTVSLIVCAMVFTGCEDDEGFSLSLPFPEGTPYEISAVFDTPQNTGQTASGLHEGIDYDIPVGTPVLASAPGTVTELQQGHIVGVSHGDFATLYAHLQSFSVQAGQEVKRGDVLGYAGNDLSKVGKPHIHFALSKGGDEKIDPQPYF